MQQMESTLKWMVELLPRIRNWIYKAPLVPTHAFPYEPMREAPKRYGSYGYDQTVSVITIFSTTVYNLLTLANPFPSLMNLPKLTANAKFSSQPILNRRNFSIRKRCWACIGSAHQTLSQARKLAKILRCIAQPPRHNAVQPATVILSRFNPKLYNKPMLLNFSCGNGIRSSLIGRSTSSIDTKHSIVKRAEAM